MKTSRASMAVAVAIPVLGLAGLARGNATNISGLYDTGDNNSYGLLNGATQDTHWQVTYASINGGKNSDTSYEGDAYVVDAGASNNSGATDNVSAVGWAANTGGGQWIAPPGATDANGNNVNTGNVYVPGNGGTWTSTWTTTTYNNGTTPANNKADANEGVFVYTLTFQIAGSAGQTAGTPVTNVFLTMDLSADDQYTVFLNPAGDLNGASVPSATDATIGTSGGRGDAWTLISPVTLPTNAGFVVGTNSIVIVVDNTNSATGNASGGINASGLLVYDMSGYVGGVLVPEVGTWIPVVGAVGLYGLVLWRRSRRLQAC